MPRELSGPVSNRYTDNCWSWNQCNRARRFSGSCRYRKICDRQGSSSKVSTNSDGTESVGSCIDKRSWRLCLRLVDGCLHETARRSEYSWLDKESAVRRATQRHGRFPFVFRGCQLGTQPG